MGVCNRKIVFFLPYKASMWDSMETVWRAAEKDTDTDAFVMPIPYYDKDENGNLGDIHWEGKLFPSDVPIVDYKRINLQAIHPDMIFIHNPYDDGNVITSVDSEYYCGNLYSWTDMLVYIPYFVLNDKYYHYDTVKKFANTSGVVYAHKTILQSEQMKKMYIDTLADLYGEDKRGFFEGKIVGWGSPKFDKVLAPELSGISIPAAWDKLIIKEDGSRRKVILYNIALAEMLEFRERTIEKIKRVLGIFKENRDRVVLLMRPHPLIRTALESMAPAIKHEYELLIDNYKSAGWGIYDDTPDLDRAIAMSDAYYGGSSSLVQLFEKAGKPIMIQNVNVL